MRCAWMTNGVGSCVGTTVDPARCTEICESGRQCTVTDDPDYAGKKGCFAMCTSNTQCGPGLACSAQGICSQSCTAATGCNGGPNGEAFTCRTATDGSMRCLPPAGSGTACQTDMECPSPARCDNGVCRNPCPAGNPLYCGDGTLCLPSGLCANPGTLTTGSPCQGPDQCAPGFACTMPPGMTTNVCTPVCDADGADACFCNRLWASGRAGVCQPPPWCPSQPAETFEWCDLCDNNGNGSADDNISVFSPDTQGAVALPAQYLGETGNIVDTAVTRLGENSTGFVVFYVVSFPLHAYVQVRAAIFLLPGTPEFYTLASQSSTGKSLPPDRHLVAAAGPISPAGTTATWIYVAYRLFTDQGTILTRFQVSPTPGPDTAMNKPLATAAGACFDPRMSALPGPGTVAVAMRKPGGSGFVLSLLALSTAVETTKDLPKNWVDPSPPNPTGHALVPQPGGGGLLHLVSETPGQTTMYPAWHVQGIGLAPALTVSADQAKGLNWLSGQAQDIVASTSLAQQRTFVMVDMGMAGNLAAFVLDSALGESSFMLPRATGPLAVTTAGDRGAYAWATFQDTGTGSYSMTAISLQSPGPGPRFGTSSASMTRPDLAFDGIRLGLAAEGGFWNGCPH